MTIIMKECDKMDWCYHCHKYYESTTSGICPYCGIKDVIETIDHTDAHESIASV